MVIGKALETKLNSPLFRSVFADAGRVIDNQASSEVWLLVNNTIWDSINNVIDSVDGVR